MGRPVRSKKMGRFNLSGRTSRQLDISSGKWSASIMADRIFRLDRRGLVAGLGAAVLSPALPWIAAAQGRPSLMLQAKASVIALRPGEANTPIWSLLGPAPDIATLEGDIWRRAE